MLVVLLQIFACSGCSEAVRDTAELSKVDVQPPRGMKRGPRDPVQLAHETRRQRPYLGSWEYSGCGNKPCPGGTKMDIAPNPWTVEDYIVETKDGPRPWQTLIFTVCAAQRITQRHRKWVAV